jgi:DNA polymerase-4
MDTFSSNPPTIMHVDINSCFATIEQQANPSLRGKPVVVAAYVTDSGSILAASREAKKLGIKTSMLVRAAKWIYPRLVVLAPDPEKYRVVNRKLAALLGEYTPYVSVESIDEMVLSLNHTPSFTKRRNQGMSELDAMRSIAAEIKGRIRAEIGEWITVSIGIAPNRYLAKVASNLEKPDGLQCITRENLPAVFAKLKLTDLTGIKEGNAARLIGANITTPLALLSADAKMLTRAFRSVLGYQWWMRLHGWEDGGIYKPFDAAPEVQKSFGQQYALPEGFAPTDSRLWQILSQLVMKMAWRLRQDGFVAHGVSLSLIFDDYTHFRASIDAKHTPLASDIDFYQLCRKMLSTAPDKIVKLIAVSTHRLQRTQFEQQSLLESDARKKSITQAMDAVHDRFGAFVVTPARMLAMKRKVLDRIAFGKAGLSSQNRLH